MSEAKVMTNGETATHPRNWVAGHVGSKMPFAWPTDGCGYKQHIKFVKHRNNHWQGGDFDAFVLEYASQLEAKGKAP